MIGIQFYINYNLELYGPFDLPKDSKVGDLRKRIADQIKLDEESVRMVLHGKILEDDGMDVEQFGNDSTPCTVYVQTKKTKPSSTTPSPTVSNKDEKSDLMRSFADNPLVKNLLSNPDILQAIVMNDPKVKELMEKNPELGHLFKDKKFLKELSDTVQSPARLNEMRRNADTAMARLDTMPGGFDMIKKMYSTIQKPYENDIQTQKDLEEEERKNNDLKRLLGVKEAPQGRINDEALPNPWAVSSGKQADNNAFSSFPPSPFYLSALERSTINQTNQSSISFSLNEQKLKYTDELSKLKDMGFSDEDKNLRALLSAGGKLDSAVNFLLQSE